MRDGVNAFLGNRRRSQIRYSKLSRCHIRCAMWINNNYVGEHVALSCEKAKFLFLSRCSGSGRMKAIRRGIHFAGTSSLKSRCYPVYLNVKVNQQIGILAWVRQNSWTFGRKLEEAQYIIIFCTLSVIYKVDYFFGVFVFRSTSFIVVVVIVHRRYRLYI